VKIKTVSLKRIKPYPNNPRKNKEAVSVVRASIEKFGYQVPIMVDAKNVIILGHTRYLALREINEEADSLGFYNRIQVVDGSDLTEKQVKQFRIVDNKTSEFAEWDLDALAEELEKMDDGLSDLKDFFKDDELVDLMKVATSEINEEMVSVKQHERSLVKNIDVCCPQCSHKFQVEAK